VTIFKIIYWAGVVAQVLIRAPFGISTRSRQKTEQRKSATENILLGLLTLSNGVLPLIYSVTDWLKFADYRLPVWLGWTGVFILICSLLIFARAHMDLKANWSPSLELYKDHNLITNGIYRFIRHPMYASQLVWCLAQMLLIQNWIAGPISLVLFIPFYLFRSTSEERMMEERFGDPYREYKQATGGILPKF